MKSTGKSNSFDKLEQNPSNSFIKDLERDLDNIEMYYIPKEQKQIKKEMIQTILDTL